MATNIGASIKLEGEKEYRNALKEIAQGQKVMRSELELVSARFEGQEKSVEGLTAKHDVLERTLNGERERIAKLREVLQKSAETYGEADSRTQGWQIQLNKAEAEAAKLEKQVDKTDKELEDLNGTMDNTEKGGRGLGDMLNGLAGKFGIELPEGMRDSVNGFVSFDASTVAAAAGAAALVAALVKVEKQLIATTKESAAAADETLTLADKTGIATDRLQEYAYAAEILDVNVDTITGAQTKLIQSMDKARDGAEAQAAAFERLGVSYQNADGTLRNSEDVFWDVLDALGGIQNETERDAAAMDVLGKSARELNPLIKAGKNEMNALAQEAHDVGYVLSNDELKALQKVDDATQRYEKSVEALKNQIAVEFAPHLEKGTKNLTELFNALGTAVKDSGVVEALGMIFESITGIVGSTGDVTDTTTKVTNALKPLAQGLALVADTLQAIVGMVQIVAGIGSLNLDTIKAGGSRFATAMGWNGNSSQQRLAQYYENSAAQSAGLYYNGQYYGNADAALYAQWEAIEGSKASFEAWKQINGYNAAGNDNWRGGVTWVGENGPERVFLPAGTQIRSAQESGMDAGITWTGNIVIDAGSIREVQDVVRIMRELPMAIRKKGR